MKTYEFTIILTLNAESEDEAKGIANNVMSNLNEMMGHAPFTCDLELNEESCMEVEYEDEDEYYEEDE